MKASTALLVSFVVGFIGAVFALGLPLLAGFGLCSVAGWFSLCSTQAYLQAAVVAIVGFTVVVGLTGFGVWWVFMRIPSTIVKAGIGLIILVVGILLFQPEIDALGILALLFSFQMGGLGVKK